MEYYDLPALIRMFILQTLWNFVKFDMQFKALSLISIKRIRIIIDQNFYFHSKPDKKWAKHLNGPDAIVAGVTMKSIQII